MRQLAHLARLEQPIGSSRAAQARNCVISTRRRTKGVDAAASTPSFEADYLVKPFAFSQSDATVFGSAFSSPPVRLLNSSRSLVVSFADTLLSRALIFDALLAVTIGTTCCDAKRFFGSFSVTSLLSRIDGVVL